MDVGLRVGVDPYPKFDWKASQDRRTHFHKVTSDRFFASAAAAAYRFDLAFIDGLHEYRQTFRDFLSVLSLSSPGAVWLIDDTVPADYFSALPSQADAFQGRAQYGNNSQAWHGDVFKLVFILHDFFPTLSICTMSTGGNPGTLVWREPRTAFKPRFGSLEAIERADYFTFARNLDLFDMKPEPEALERAVAGARRYAGKA